LAKETRRSLRSLTRNKRKKERKSRLNPRWQRFKSVVGCTPLHIYIKV